MIRLVALVLASTLVAVLVAEALLRLADQSYYWAYAKRPDAQLGWRPPPNHRGWQRFEGSALVETNALGFRDHHHELVARDGVLRIAVLGDSFTEAVQVPLEQTWWRRMAAELNAGDCAIPATGARRGPSTSEPTPLLSPTSTPMVEVMSFAVSGYSTAQSLLAWRHIARSFAPDLVLLAFFIGNDLTENHPELDAQPLRPYLRPAPALSAGGLMLDAGFLESAEYRAARTPLGRLEQALRERSRLLQLVIQARDALRIRGLAVGRPALVTTLVQGSAEGSASLPPAAPQELGVDNAVYAPPVTRPWRETWGATAAMLEAFAAEVRAAGAEPAVMIIGTGAQVHPNAAGRARFAAALELEDLGYPVRRLLAIAEQERLPVINLPARWTSDERAQGALLHGFEGGRPGFGHWNAVGHQAAADAAVELVCWLMSARGPT